MIPTHPNQDGGGGSRVTEFLPCDSQEKSYTPWSARITCWIRPTLSHPKICLKCENINGIWIPRWCCLKCDNRVSLEFEHHVPILFSNIWSLRADILTQKKEIILFHRPQLSYGLWSILASGTTGAVGHGFVSARKIIDIVWTLTVIARISRHMFMKCVDCKISAQTGCTDLAKYRKKNFSIYVASITYNQFFDDQLPCWRPHYFTCFFCW